MPNASERYRDNLVWNAAEQCNEVARAKSALDEADSDRLKRVFALCALVKSYKTANPLVLPSTWEATCDDLRVQLDEIARQLSGWNDEAAMPVSTVNQLDASGDAALTYLRSWPPAISSTTRAQQVADIAAAYEASSDATLQGLRSAVERLSTRVDGYDEAAKSFTAQVETLTADSAALVTKTDASVAETVTEGAKKFDDKVDELTASSEEIVKELEARASRAKELLAMIGGEGVGDGYNKYADAQQRAAFVWSVFAVLLGIAAVGWIAAVLWEVKDDTHPNPATLILKAAVTVTAITVAGYMTRLAAHHRAQAVRAKFRALDMLALGPFSDNLSDEDKKTLMMEVGRSSFGPQPEKDPPAVMDQIRSIGKN